MGEIIAHKVLSCDACMSEKDVIELATLYEDELPEINFITTLYNNLKKRSKLNNKLSDSGIVTVFEFSWDGVNSGDSYNLLLTGVYPKIKGYAEVVYVWEDGTINGVKVNNGNIKQCKVEHRLV